MILNVTVNQSAALMVAGRLAHNDLEVKHGSSFCFISRIRTCCTLLEFMSPELSDDATMPKVLDLRLPCIPVLRLSQR